MDYEQKYKEALGWMKSLYGGLHGKTKEEAEKYFPELAESEDERIRKVQLDYWRSVGGKEWHGVPVQEVIAWLEKQGEQKPFDYENAMIIQKDFAPKEVTFTREVETGNGNIKALVTQKSPAESLGISPEKYEEIVNECIYGESVDKVVPKFKIGDWVVFIASENVYQVEKIENYEYTLRHTLGGSMPLPFSSEELIRPWTIKDVKPGDVLVGKIDGDNYILIFKQIKDGWIETYGHYYDAVNRFCIPSQLFCRDYKGTFYPATKEQRDTLAKAMAEEGYTFDFEKKELKKIENEPENFKQQLASEMADLIIDYVKQKPADIEQNLSNSKKVEKNDTLLDLLHKMPSCITVDGIFYHFMLRKTALAYTAYYAGEEEGSGMVIFATTAHSPIDLLTDMLEELKEKGLLEGGQHD